MFVHEYVLANPFDLERDIAERFKSYFFIESNGRDFSITPKKCAEVLLDDREGHIQKLRA